MILYVLVLVHVRVSRRVWLYIIVHSNIFSPARHHYSETGFQQRPQGCRDFDLYVRKYIYILVYIISSYPWENMIASVDDLLI